MSHVRFPTEASAVADVSLLFPNLPIEISQKLMSHLDAREQARLRNLNRSFRDEMPCWRPQILEDSKAIPESLPDYFSVDLSLITTPENGRAHLAAWLGSLPRPSLRRLILPARFTREEAQGLSGMAALEILALPRSLLWSQHVQDLLTALTPHSALRSLDISGADNLGNVAIPALSTLRLTELYASGCRGIGAHFLTGLPVATLRRLDLRDSAPGAYQRQFSEAVSDFQRAHPDIAVASRNVRARTQIF